MGLIPSGEEIVVWFAARWYRDGLKGKKGQSMKEALTKVQGARTAIMAFVLLAEVLATQLGYEAGPVFATLRGLGAAIGWDFSTVKDVTGLDLTAIGTAMVTIYVAVRRLLAWKQGTAQASK